MERNISVVMIQVLKIENVSKVREVNWVLKSCFDIGKREHERIKVVKKLLMAECESQKASGSLQRGLHLP